VRADGAGEADPQAVTRRVRRLDRDHVGVLGAAGGRHQYAVNVVELMGGKQLGVVGLHPEREPEPHATDRERERRVPARYMYSDLVRESIRSS